MAEGQRLVSVVASLERDVPARIYQAEREVESQQGKDDQQDRVHLERHCLSVHSGVEHEEHDRQDHQEDCQAHVFSAVSRTELQGCVEEPEVDDRESDGDMADGPEVGPANQTRSEEYPEETVENQRNPKEA